MRDLKLQGFQQFLHLPSNCFQSSPCNFESWYKPQDIQDVHNPRPRIPHQLICHCKSKVHHYHLDTNQYPKIQIHSEFSNLIIITNTYWSKCTNHSQSIISKGGIFIINLGTIVVGFDHDFRPLKKQGILISNFTWFPILKMFRNVFWKMQCALDTYSKRTPA